MKQLKKFAVALAFLLMAGVYGMACVVYAAPVEGQDYKVLANPQPTRNKAQIEVIEFFWYGCHHCYNFEPIVAAWKKTLADDVVFRGSPAIWNAAMELHARTYYTAEVLGVLDKMNPILFQAMNVDGKKLATEEEIRALFVANGVAAEDFTKAFESFGVKNQVTQAGARARAAKITGTPAIMVDGKYHVSTRKAGGHAEVLKVADFLIEKERVARAAK